MPNIIVDYVRHRLSQLNYPQMQQSLSRFGDHPNRSKLRGIHFKIKTSVRVNKLERNITDAFKGSVEDFHNGKILGEDDFRASLYHHLRKYTDKNKIITMLMGASVGGHKPDISIFKGEDCLVTIELKAISKEKGEIKSYDPSSIRDCMETLKLCAPHSERGYFIHIDENDQGYNDGFAEWKDDYYRNLWHEVEGDMTYIFEVKKGRTNKRRV